MKLADEARWWTISGRLAVAIFIVPLAGVALLALVTPAHGVYHFLVREDSVVEWLQVAGYAVAAVAAGIAAKRTNGLQRVAFAGLALGCLLLLGEEISWGQRIFGFDTPLHIAKENRQGELTFHNLDDESDAFAYGQLVIGVAGAIVPWLLVRRWWVPPRFLSSAFLVLGVYWLVRLRFEPYPHYDFAKFSEWPETCFSLAVGVFAVLTVRRERLAAHGRSRSGG